MSTPTILAGQGNVINGNVTVHIDNRKLNDSGIPCYAKVATGIVVGGGLVAATLFIQGSPLGSLLSAAETVAQITPPQGIYVPGVGEATQYLPWVRQGLQVAWDMGGQAVVTNLLPAAIEYYIYGPAVRAIKQFQEF